MAVPWVLDPGRALTLRGPAVNDRPVATIGHVAGTAAHPHSPADTDTLAHVIVDALNAAALAPHRPVVVGHPVITCALCGKAVRGGGPSYPDPLPYIHAEV